MIFGILGLVFTALRFYQMTALTDPETGFFTDRSNITVTLYYIMWGAIVLGGLISFYISDDIKPHAYAPRKNILQAVASLALGAGALHKSLTDIAGMKESSGGMQLLAYVRMEKEFLTLAGAILGMLTFVAMLIDAAGFVSGRDFNTKLRATHLIPVLWMFTVTVSYFSITVSYLNVTQLMLMIFADAFFMIFVFEYARFLTDTGSEEAPWLLYATGVISLIFLVSSLLPNIWFTLSGKTEMINRHCPLNVYGIGSAVFTAISLITAKKNRFHVLIPVAPIEDEKTESEE